LRKVEIHDWNDQITFVVQDSETGRIIRRIEIYLDEDDRHDLVKVFEALGIEARYEVAY